MKLGDKLRDTVTGFTGIATARVEYLNGCVQFHLRPKTGESGKFPDGQYIDEEQLELLSLAPAGRYCFTATSTGGDKADVPTGSYDG